MSECVEQSFYGANAVNQRGLEALQQGDVIGAISLLERAVSIEPTNPIFLNNLSVALQQSGNTEEACKVAFQALKLAPSERVIVTNALKLSAQAGHTEVVERLVELARTLFPNDPEFEQFGLSSFSSHEAGCNQGSLIPPSWHRFSSHLRVGENVIFGSGAQLDIQSDYLDRGIRIQIGNDSQIFGALSILRSSATIALGARSQLGSSRLSAAGSIEIGDDVLMAWGISVVDHDGGSFDWRERRNMIQREAEVLRKGYNRAIHSREWHPDGIRPVKIGRRAWVGFNVIVMKGVSIGEGAVIGAGAVVSEDVPAYCVAAGNYARVIKQLPVPLDAIERPY